MIGQLRGRLAEKRPNQVLIDVGGVGYLAQVPLSTYAALGELHTEVTLLIYTHVREDALALFGFVSAREKHFFELLISVIGTGASQAKSSWVCSRRDTQMSSPPVPPGRSVAKNR